jgi:hypothetical protein
MVNTDQIDHVVDRPQGALHCDTTAPTATSWPSPAPGVTPMTFPAIREAGILRQVR